MKIGILFIISVLFLSGCGGNGIDDTSKRNENWVWWVDAKTGEGEWIPFADQTTVKTGQYTTFYFNGKINLKGSLLEGEKTDTAFVFDLNEEIIKYDIYGSDTMTQYYLHNGPYADYYPSGKIKQKGIVTDHTPRGQWTTYYENGNIKWSENIVNKTGYHVSYYENGFPRDSVFYRNDLQDGRSKYWYKNGQLKETSDWKMGKQHGLYQIFFENGYIEETTTWVDGKREGKSEVWYENGQKEHITYKKNGESEGEVLAWYPNGNLKSKLNYQNGKKNGPFVFYHENGKVQSTAIYVDDKPDGEVNVYDSTGTLFQKQIYLHGELINHVDVVR